MLYSPLRHWTYRCSERLPILRYFSVWCRRSLNEGANGTHLQPNLLETVLSSDKNTPTLRERQDENTSSTGHGGPFSSTTRLRPPKTTDVKEEGVLAARSRGLSQVPHDLHNEELTQGGNFFSSDAPLYETKEDLPSENLTRSWRFVDPQTLTRYRTLNDAYESIKKALDSEDQQGLLQTIWEIAQNDKAVASITSTTFVEILRKLDPSDEFLPFRYGYTDRIPKHYRMLASQNQQQLEQLKMRRAMYQEICNSRVRHGRDLSVREYSQLFKCARGTWDGRFASQVMMDMISKKLQPDLACYNYYFEVKCWSDAWYPDERQLLRVFPYALSRRDRFKRYLSEGVTIYPYRIGPEGLKSEVTHVFTHMIEGGIMADGKAFSSLITALGREGDMEGVKAVIKKAWEVDVDAIDKRETEKTTAKRTSSPLFPNQDLLFVIAHTFGSNNDVPTALRVIDYFSRTFTIPIPPSVWAELLEWSFTLSTRRHKRRKEDGAQLGQLAVQTPEDLWHVLTSEPYNCKPTLPMYDVMIRGLRRRDRLFPMLKYTLEGLEMHKSNMERYKRHVHHKSYVNPEIHNQTSVHLRQQRFASFVAVNGWFSLLLNGQRWLSQTNQSRIIFWQRQLLPDVVDIFWRYRQQRGVEYIIRTGRVHLQEESTDSER